MKDRLKTFLLCESSGVNDIGPGFVDIAEAARKREREARDAHTRCARDVIQRIVDEFERGARRVSLIGS